MAAVLGLPLLAVLAAGPHGNEPKPPAPHQTLPPFLDLFKAPTQPPPVVRDVVFTSAAGPVRGLLARPAGKEALPAVLLLPDETGLDDWMKENARDLCSIGYVVLALDLYPGRRRSSGQARAPAAALADERTLARTSAAVRWLRRRADVLPERVGVLGWSSGAAQALAVAAATPLQACVVCDGCLTTEPALLAGLRGTPLLGICASRDEPAHKALPAFRQALAAARIVHRMRVYEGVEKGFMRTTGTMQAKQGAEEAWVEIYEFLGKYVEDAPEREPMTASLPQVAPGRAVATIADIMQAVNDPTGVRGTLIRLLEKEPADTKQWAHAHAHAALLAEGGRLLQSRNSPRGSQGSWNTQAKAFTAAAENIVIATARRDYGAARRGLQSLAGHCAACHRVYR